MTTRRDNAPGSFLTRLSILYLSLRMSTLGFTLMLPLLGAAFASQPLGSGHTAWLLVAAFAFHAYSYMLNDVVDLDLDRTEPQRADSPLVRGALSSTVVLTAALLAVPTAFVSAAIAEATSGWLVIAFLAMTVYNLWGKRCRWPLVTDSVQAAGWCALLGLGIPAGAATEVHAWIVAYVFACVLVVQGVHGGLRDLENDRRRGARTTASWFGARVLPDGGLLIPAPLLVYAGALQVSMVLFVIGAWRSMGADRGSMSLVVVTLATAAMLLISVALILVAQGRWRPAGGQQRSLANVGAWHIVSMLVVLLMVASARLPADGIALLWLVFAAPVAALWAYNGTHWHLARGADRGGR